MLRRIANQECPLRNTLLPRTGNKPVVCRMLEFKTWCLTAERRGDSAGKFQRVYSTGRFVCVTNGRFVSHIAMIFLCSRIASTSVNSCGNGKVYLKEKETTIEGRLSNCFDICEACKCVEKAKSGNKKCSQLPAPSS